ncbi:hypothetical protein PtB15_3B52 [Puccinia triticina]|nr:hypothetical protein PtB15_3B52 [Puccinia triticina]
MVPRQSLNSYNKRTTSCIVQFWMVIWLTCFVFLENVQCEFNRGLASIRGFDYNPELTWPSPALALEDEARPAGNRRLATGGRDRPAGTSARRSRAGKEAAPRFKIINSAMPAEPVNWMVFAAVRSLQQTNGKRLIGGKEKGDEYRMLRIEEQQIQSFLAEDVHRVRSTSDSSDRPRIGRPRPAGKPLAEFTTAQVIRRRDARRKIDQQATELPEFKEVYTDRVLLGFTETLKLLRTRIRTRIEYLQAWGTLGYLTLDLEGILAQLAPYLFYVDLINTVIPAPGVAASGEAAVIKFVESQRSLAGEMFLDYVGGVIENHFLDTEAPVLGKLGGLNLVDVDAQSKFGWRLVTRWMETWRASLAAAAREHSPNEETHLSKLFKQLFNEIVTGYVESLVAARNRPAS